MKPAHVALIIILVLLITPVGFMWGSAARARHARGPRPTGRSNFGPTATRAVMPGQVFNPATPTGFALVPGNVVYQTYRPEPVFTDSRGLNVHRVEIPDRAPFLVAHDPTHCGHTPPTCWHRSPDLPGYGGYGDWLIELDQIRTVGGAIGDLTLTDLRALEAFLEYGRTQRAHQNGAHL